MSLFEQSSSSHSAIENRNQTTFFFFLPLIEQEVDKEGSTEVICDSMYLRRTWV